jgi:diguanylate cyclase (GGDEF)-like protein
VNDVFGHAEGDAYILKVVDVLRLFSDEAVICRLGGDEFMMLSGNCEIEEAENKLEGLRSLLANNTSGEESARYYSISYGVVRASASGKIRASELLGMADEKMYKYKRERKMQRNGKQIASSPEDSQVLLAE